MMNLSHPYWFSPIEKVSLTPCLKRDFASIFHGFHSAVQWKVFWGGGCDILGLFLESGVLCLFSNLEGIFSNLESINF